MKGLLFSVMVKLQSSRRFVWSSTSHTHFGRCWLQTWFLILPPAHISSRCGNWAELWCVEGWQENVKSCYCVSPLMVSTVYAIPDVEMEMSPVHTTHTRQPLSQHRPNTDSLSFTGGGLKYIAKIQVTGVSYCLHFCLFYAHLGMFAGNPYYLLFSLVVVASDLLY